ncbi:unnamed protein product [Symbiodinium pilosum]|uniref:Ubiquitin-like domain-containing protein n=1 Tax=Symbiodinium pilosum TaxID=2952 RepID=A0A812V7Z7_SYMPI|nr:unnamed protein product [Symbiodinium pilosum]
MALSVSVVLLSGQEVTISALPDSPVFQVQIQAQKALGLRIARLLVGEKPLERGRTLKEEGVFDRDVLTAVVQPDRIYSCQWSLGFTLIRSDGTTVAWGDPDRGGEPLCEQLQDVDAVLATENVQAVLHLDGTVAMWGHPDWHGGHESLQEVHKLQAFPKGLAAIKMDYSVMLIGCSRYVTTPPPLSGVRQVAACQGSMSEAYAAVLNDGRVVAWGCPQLGGNCSAVESELWGVREVKSCNSNTAGAFAAIREDGRVITWGSRSYGGDSSAVQAQLCDVQDVASTSFAFAAVKTDGTVICWGAPALGGDCSIVQEKLRDVLYICASCGSFAALRGDGSVVTWGCEKSGADSFHVQQKLTAVQQIIASRSAFAALRTDGSVVTWGHAAAGGDCKSVQARLLNIQHIAASAYAFAALRSDGEVVTWGRTWGSALYSNWDAWIADPRKVTWTLTGLAKKKRVQTAALVLQSLRYGLLEVNIFQVTAVMSIAHRLAGYSTHLALIRPNRAGLNTTTVAQNAAIAAAALGDWRLAHNLASQACTQGLVDRVTLGSVMAVASWEKAVSLLTLSRLLLHQPLDPICLRTTMTSSEKLSHWENVLQLLRHFYARPGDIGAASFNPAISACEKGLQWQFALHILGMAGDRRWRPSDVSWAAAVSACEKAGPWQRALSLSGSTAAGLVLPLSKNLRREPKGRNSPARGSLLR